MFITNKWLNKCKWTIFGTFTILKTSPMPLSTFLSYDTTFRRPSVPLQKRVGGFSRHLTAETSPNASENPICLFTWQSHWHISDLYPIYFHIWMRPETDLEISECMRFFPVYTVIEHIRSVSHMSKKIGIGSHFTDSVNEAKDSFSLLYYKADVPVCACSQLFIEVGPLYSSL